MATKAKDETIDRAHEALKSILNTLEPFDADTQCRVLMTVCVFLELIPTKLESEKFKLTGKQ